MEWINVEDNLPALGVPVLTIFRGSPLVLELCEGHPSYEETFKPFKYWNEPSSEILEPDWYEVTHWMPLPELPEDCKVL
jgi:hypothetical protein